MILLLVLTIFGFIIGIWLSWKDKLSADQSIMISIFATLVGFAVTIAVGGMIASGAAYKTQYGEYDQVKIVALKNSLSTEGSIFLLVGDINSRPCYLFYYEMPDGGKKLGKLSAETITVYEESRQDAYLAKSGVVKKTFEKEWLRFFVPTFMLKKDGFSYSIHVPEGTIKRNINLDLNNLNQ